MHNDEENFCSAMRKNSEPRGRILRHKEDCHGKCNDNHCHRAEPNSVRCGKQAFVRYINEGGLQSSNFVVIYYFGLVKIFILQTLLLNSFLYMSAFEELGSPGLQLNTETMKSRVRPANHVTICCVLLSVTEHLMRSLGIFISYLL